jgi:hypothetical protein
MAWIGVFSLVYPVCMLTWLGLGPFLAMISIVPSDSPEKAGAIHDFLMMPFSLCLLILLGIAIQVGLGVVLMCFGLNKKRDLYLVSVMSWLLNYPWMLRFNKDEVGNEQPGMNLLAVASSEAFVLVFSLASVAFFCSGLAYFYNSTLLANRVNEHVALAILAGCTVAFDFVLYALKYGTLPMLHPAAFLAGVSGLIYLFFIKNIPYDVAPVRTTVKEGARYA